MKTEEVSKKMGLRVFAVALAVFLACGVLVTMTSAVFSSQGFTASAYTRADLDRAESTEADARQALEDAQAEADRLVAIKQGFNAAGQDEIISNLAFEIREKMESELTLIMDDVIADISEANDQDEIENVLDGAAINIANLINDLVAIAQSYFDEYIEIFLDDDVDYFYVWDTLHTKIASGTGYIDFLLWDLFFDDDGSAIDVNAAIVYSAIQEETDNVENAILDEVSGWVDSCIDGEIESVMGDLEKKWLAALETLVEIRQAIYEYDYSVSPEAYNYTKYTRKDIVFEINGDFDAVRKIDHFDMQKKPVWNDFYEDEVIFGERLRLGVDYFLERIENNTIIVTIDNAFLNKRSQGDHLFRLYYITEDEDNYVSFGTLVMPTGWVKEDSYDDGQDWEEEPVILIESKDEDEDEEVSDADAGKGNSFIAFISSISPGMWIIIASVLAILIVAAIVIILIIIKKKKKALRDENEDDKVEVEESEKPNRRRKNRANKRTNNKAVKTLLSLTLILCMLAVYFPGLAAHAVSVSNIRLSGSIPDKEPLAFDGSTVTVSGYAATYSFNVSEWSSSSPSDPLDWADTSFAGNGCVSSASGPSQNNATFSVSMNDTSGARNGTVTINSPGGSKSFTVRQRVITYTISYNANGGSGAPGNQIKTHRIDINLSQASYPTREGYTFIGWSTSSTAKSAPNAYKPGKKYTTNKDLTLYAVWKANNITITWDANGGTGSKYQSKTVGTKIGTLPKTKRENYDFQGWFSSTIITPTTIVPVKDTTYYARWTLKDGQSHTLPIGVGRSSLSFTYDSDKTESVTVSNYKGSSENINYWKKVSVSKPSWVIVDDKTEGTLKISVKNNPNTESRSCAVVVTSYDKSTRTISISQTAKPVPVKSVSLPSKATVNVGGTVTLTAVIDPWDAANRSVTWSSDNTAVATVNSSGKVTGITEGTAKITAKSKENENLTATCKVTVIPAKANSITVSPAALTMYVGEKKTLSVAFEPSNTTNQKIEWSRQSSWFGLGTAVADVKSTGDKTAEVIANTIGTIIITAKTTDGSNKNDTCVVTVKAIDGEYRLNKKFWANVRLDGTYPVTFPIPINGQLKEIPVKIKFTSPFPVVPMNASPQVKIENNKITELINFPITAIGPEIDFGSFGAYVDHDGDSTYGYEIGIDVVGIEVDQHAIDINKRDFKSDGSMDIGFSAKCKIFVSVSVFEVIGIKRYNVVETFSDSITFAYTDNPVKLR